MIKITDKRTKIIKTKTKLEQEQTSKKKETCFLSWKDQKGLPSPRENNVPNTLDLLKLQ